MPARGDAAAQAGRAARVHIDLVIGRSAIEEKRGDAAMAARRLDEALAKSPDEPRLLVARAGVEERRGDWRRAIAFAERLLQREPRSVEALNFLGFVAADHNFERRARSSACRRRRR